jgi:lantibiotic leader peptide-processing serine protease
VAVLDSGIDCAHPDLSPNLNAGLSTSFVPGEIVCVQVIGVAPHAEIVAVKVLSEFTGSGAFDWLINGIVYAADSGADVINMSLGGYLFKSGDCSLPRTATPHATQRS